MHEIASVSLLSHNDRILDSRFHGNDIGDAGITIQMLFYILDNEITTLSYSFSIILID